jgi:hypothetical protein
VDGGKCGLIRYNCVYTNEENITDANICQPRR